MADNSELVTVGQNLVRAVGALTQMVAKVFPQGQQVTTSAGAASGKYLTVTGPDGNTYKIPLLNPS